MLTMVQNPETYAQSQAYAQSHLSDYIRMLLSRKWIVLLGFIATLAATIYYLETTPPVYEARSVLLYEKQRPAPVLFEFEKTQLLLPQTAQVEAQRQIIKSPLVLNEIIKRLKNRPDFHFKSYGELESHITVSSPGPREANLIQVSATSSKPALAADIANTAADLFLEKNAERKNADLDQAVSFISGQLTVFDKLLRESEQELSRFRQEEGTVVFQGAEAGQRVLGLGLLSQFGQLQKELLEAQTQQQLLTATLASVQDFLKKKSKQFDPREQSSLLSGATSAQIQELQRKIVVIQVELDAKRRILQENNPDTIVLKEQLLATQSRLEIEFVKMIKSRELGSDPILEWQNLVRQEIDLNVELKGQEQKIALLEDKIKVFKSRHPELISKELELAQLERKVRQYEGTYTFLMQRLEEAKMRRQMQVADYIVVSSAFAPESPIRPRKLKTLLLGIILGLMLGLGGAFFLEYMDDSLKSKEEVERFLGLPVVGEIPYLSLSKDVVKKVQSALNIKKSTADPRSKRRSRKVRKANKRSENQRLAMVTRNIGYLSQADIESYTRLQMVVQFASIDWPVKTLLITSSTPGEGKTLTAGNLAIVSALSGKRTLLVDCDFRRPRTHVFLEQPLEPGLSEYILDLSKIEEFSQPERLERLAQVSPERFIRVTNIKNLFLLPSGKRPPNPVSILNSDMISKLIAQWREKYDMVVIDSPPVLSVADASVLASKVDKVLIVVRSGWTKCQPAHRAKETLETFGSRIFGVVLNGIDFSKGYSSYYYHYYHQQKDQDNLLIEG